MTTRRLTYDGTTYELRGEAMADLLARGIIVPDASSGADYSPRLSMSSKMLSRSPRWLSDLTPRSRAGLDSFAPEASA